MGPDLSSMTFGKKKEEKKLGEPVRAITTPVNNGIQSPINAETARPKFAKEDIYQDYLDPKNAKFDKNKAIQYLNEQGFDTNFMNLPAQQQSSGNMMSGGTPGIIGIDPNQQLNATLARARKYQDEASAGRTKELYGQVGKDIESLKGQKEGLLHARMQPELRSGRRAIADKMRELQRFNQKHGLIGSGTAQYEAAKVGADFNQAMEKNRYSKREELNDEISKLEDLYQRAGISQSGGQLQSQYQSQLNAIKNSMDEMQGYGEVGKSLGQIGGAYLANRNKEK